MKGTLGNKTEIQEILGKGCGQEKKGKRKGKRKGKICKIQGKNVRRVIAV